LVTHASCLDEWWDMDTESVLWQVIPVSKLNEMTVWLCPVIWDAHTLEA